MAEQTINTALSNQIHARVVRLGEAIPSATGGEADMLRTA
jgi:hypothetical protein